MNNQPIIDNIIIWKGFGYPHKPNNPWDSKCRLRIWQQNPVIVLFSDLDIPDTGTSITNCCENISSIVQFHFRLQNPIRWFEHYPRHHRSLQQQQESLETVDEIFYDYDEKEQRYKKPRWKAYDRKSFEKLVNCSILIDDVDSLTTISLANPWQKHQEDFKQGLEDRRNRKPLRNNPTKAYQEGYFTAMQEQHEFN
ncbi:hypothetical protein [Cyanothece sp. BG0011]|uniref:hypothetical protein n=1 Tax=Cyanothece sp. BG0011 TaxID=2082950 RepID=UPI0013006934|nr:hypothetical protein [Cyanothece sp. BG0011]